MNGEHLLSEGLTFQLHKNLRSENSSSKMGLPVVCSFVYYSVTGDVAASSSQRHEQSQIKHNLVVVKVVLLLYISLLDVQPMDR